MNEDSIRYSRLEALPEIGREGLQLLAASRVLVIGCGALGSMAAMYLAASGIGTVGIADFDTIDITNLQRQLFFDEHSLGKSKADVLAARMRALNSEIKVNVEECLVTEKKAHELFPEYDFVIDGSDNPATKFMTDRVCSDTQTPCCIGGVGGFRGQVMSWHPGATRYSEVFSPQECSAFTPCGMAGVLGPAAGVVASIQAAEAIKHSARCGTLLLNRLFTIDLLTLQPRILEI